VWRITHPAAEGNPIGAGDAFSAALALALTQRAPFEQALQHGAAAAVASLKTPTAGALHPADFDAALATIQIHQISRVVSR
jgi:tagatose 6-phosphate kinase